ncbi:MAG: Zn-ribbon containing protein [Candidatus Thermoplasmatota archaeon]|jgi:predicted  nucleic acid-binding Zn-ribbon protein|nr:Zn-ribbon containing protein [Candidatus Thermoplasmatota archaeon]
MPHQCLKCGKIFKEGSNQLLKGCPVCNGNHFFYTKEPLNEEKRKSLNEKLNKDINSKLVQIINDQAKELVKETNWINIKTEDLNEEIEKFLAKTKKIIPNNKENIEIITEEKYRKENIEKIEHETSKFNEPETINIEEPGKYRIDVKGLLEQEPIIIQKDGSYTIHLPSVFKMINKEKKE